MYLDLEKDLVLATCSHSKCLEKRLCIRLYNKDESYFLCLNCINLIKEIFNLNIETHECKFIYNSEKRHFECMLCNRVSGTKKEET